MSTTFAGWTLTRAKTAEARLEFSQPESESIVRGCGSTLEETKRLRDEQDQKVRVLSVDALLAPPGRLKQREALLAALSGVGSAGWIHKPAGYLRTASQPQRIVGTTPCAGTGSECWKHLVTPNDVPPNSKMQICVCCFQQVRLLN